MDSQVKGIINTVVGRPVDQVDGFVTRGLLDSLMMVQLIVQIEKEFGISITADDLAAENFDSIAAIKALINKTKGTK